MAQIDPDGHCHECDMKSGLANAARLALRIRGSSPGYDDVCRINGENGEMWVDNIKSATDHIGKEVISMVP